SGMADLTISTLSVGSHMITAIYSGESNFDSSVGSLFYGETVYQDTTTTTLSSSANRASPGQPITFTATVTANAPGSGTPTGMVTFMTAKTTMGTVAVDSAGHATLTINDPPPGTTATIFAVYSGDNNFLASTGSMLQTGGGSAATNTTTTLTSSLSPSSLGQAVTFTAIVTT